MRNTLIIALVIAAAGITGAAQGTSNGVLVPGISTFSADRIQSQSKEETILSGHVTITAAGVTLTADRAILHLSSQTMDLEGHVQLKVNSEK
jgi:lipopolysaccharide assembly outer membrane protein LptD (OstA)